MRKRQDKTLRSSPILEKLFISIIMIGLLAGCLPSSSKTPAQPPAPTATPTASPNLPTPSLPAQTPSAPTPPHPPHTPANTAAPSATPDCLQTGGSLNQTSFFSDTMQADMNVLIYLPPCYPASSQTGLPVLYLLHGLSYTNQQWIRLGLVREMDARIAAGEIPPFIVVLPQESRFLPPQTSGYDLYIVNDLIPWIDQQFQTLADADHRAIGGLSRGAAWAVRIGFEHAGLFDAVGAHSLPLFEADSSHVYGWLLQAPPDELPRFYIDIGRNDMEWASALVFANQLDEYNIRHEWALFNGDHNEAYWESHLEDYLQWYAKYW